MQRRKGTVFPSCGPTQLVRSNHKTDTAPNERRGLASFAREINERIRLVRAAHSGRLDEVTLQPSFLVAQHHRSVRFPGALLTPTRFVSAKLP
jgi:hypothetical protein